MSDAQIAVLSTLIIYAFGYVVSLYAVSFWFSTGLMPLKWRQLSSTPIVFKAVLFATIFVPLSTWFVFHWAVSADNSHSVDWNSYLGHVSLGAHFIWFILFKPMVVGFIVGLITPETMGFSGRDKAVLAFLMHNIGSYAMIQIVKLVIEKTIPMS
jgi:hypothetical protein